MRMRRKYYSKNMIEVLDYHNYRTYKKNGKRMPRMNTTSEEVAKYNEKMAEAMLRLLIDNNFKANDYYITLTYTEQPTWETAKEDIRKFIKRLQYKYKKEGQELKYIYVVEGKRRIHFHMIINASVKIYADDLMKLWKHGYTKLVLYRGRPDDAVRLAKYFIKERRSVFYEKNEVFKKRWVSSQNLIKPKKKTETLKSDVWSVQIKVPKGYYLETDSVVEGVSIMGYPYRAYRLLKIPEEGGAHGN